MVSISGQIARPEVPDDARISTFFANLKLEPLWRIFYRNSL